MLDLPTAPYAPTGLRQPSRWRFQQSRWGDAWRQGSGNDKPGLSYTGMYPISHERMSDGETPGYRGPGMGQLCRGRGMGQLDLARLIPGAQKLASSVVKGVIFKTNATGALRIEQPLEPGQSAPPPTVQGGNPISTQIMKLLQPGFYIVTPAGILPMEPYGEPRSDYSAVIAGLVVLGAATAVVGGLCLASKVLKRP
jgi:hypothetical protein